MKYMPKLSLSLIAVLLVLPGLSGCDSDNNGGTGGPVAPTTQTLTVLVSGGGTVTSLQQPGIANCTATGGTCTASFPSGSSVQLTATPASGQAFRAWAGACTPSNATPCTVLMDRQRQEVAVFESAAASGLGDTFALTASGRLLSFNRASPGTINLNATISGLTAGDVPVAIDYRPSNGLLYALTKAADNKGRLYVLAERTATATLVAQSSIDLAGSDFGMTFDPSPNTDVLRSVSDTGQNLSINPSTGNANLVGTISNTRTITALAFTNAFKGTQSTVSYVLDSASDQLYTTILSVAAPTFTLIGNLTDGGPVDVPAVNGFDIDAVNGAAYVAYNLSPSSPVLRTIDLNTGAVGSAVSIGVSNETIRGLALPTPRDPEVFAICESSATPPPTPPATNPSANNNACVNGLTLLKFAASNPAAYTVVANVSGMDPGETVLELDFRPATGVLVALGSTGKLYNINPVTAQATSPRALTPVVGDDNPFQMLDSSKRYGMDFNPLVDRLRVVGRSSSVREADAPYNINLRINPDDGATTTDGALQRTPFTIAGVAFSNNANGASASTLYALDSQADRLYTLNSGLGRLTLVGSLGLDASDVGGFEIISTLTPPSTFTNAAYAIWGDGSNSRLHMIDLTTGAAALVGSGNIGSSSGFTGELVAASATVNQGLATEFFAATKGINPSLVSFSPATPQTFTSNRPITGLQAPTTEEVVALDFRPSDNVLYLLTNAGRLYTVNIAGQAAATLRGTLSTPGAPPVAFPMTGIRYGMDFTPVGTTTDSIKLVDDTGRNVSINPTTAIVSANTNLIRHPNPAIHAAAYTNNFSGATSTKLLVFNVNDTADGFPDRIMLLDPPNSGFLEGLSASTGLDAAEGTSSSFDIIGGHDGLALLALRKVGDVSTDAFTTVYTVNPVTGVVVPSGSAGNIIGRASTPQAPPDTRVVVRTIAVRFTP